MNPVTVAFHHFGCKVNFAEASSISRDFKQKGFVLKNHHEVADIYVISTCVVTQVAEKKCRAAIHQAHKLNPNARIAVIGCFSELKPGELMEMEGVDLVLGNSSKYNLLDELEKLSAPKPLTYDLGPMTAAEQPQTAAQRLQTAAQRLQTAAQRLQTAAQRPEPTTTIRSIARFVPSYSYGDRTRSFLKIQDGCDYHCSYCTIPLARGHSRSDSISHIVSAARDIVNQGIREIVLTGVNIGDFGKHNGESFYGLMLALEDVEGLFRIRISSLEPDLLSDEIISQVASSSRFMPHFHLPLQSGSDAVLKAMKRKYDTGLYADRVRKIRQVLPFACIASDVITGFPSETEEKFNETFHFLDQLQVSYMHVFSYSKRENTLASRIENLVTDKVKKERSKMLHSLSDKKKSAFYLSNAGREVNVLFESDNSEGWMHGFSENYIRVKTAYNPSLSNQVVRLSLNETDSEGLYIYSTSPNNP